MTSSNAALRQPDTPEPDLQFDFGANWADFSRHVNERRIAEATEGLNRLLPPDELQGRDFLDIGCGSGLHSLAASRLGAGSITAIDVNPRSVATTKAVLAKFAPERSATVLEHSILSAEFPAELQRSFDIVYSWGVLHHTGHMGKAIAQAATRVKPGGLFVLAIYKRSPLCGFWRAEKKFYTKAPRPVRAVMDYFYAASYLGAYGLTGKNPVSYVREYHTKRGMSWMTDVRDWLGGYPYESATAPEMQGMMAAQGFELVRAFNTDKPKACGVFGSGCAEYVFRKK